MYKIAAVLGAALAIGLGTVPSHAQATRTWVSGTGNDANPCSRTAPCQTFAGAFTKTATNGEINVIDAGGFGTVNITKSITIDGLGPMASILAVGTNGVIINGAGIVVTLRNLTINGASSTTGNGIRILNAAEVNIDNVVMENFGGASPSNGRGVSIETAGNVLVTIQNSRISNANFIGIHSNPTAGLVRLAVKNTSIVNGGSTAIQLRQLTTGMLDNVTATGNVGAGMTTELTSVNMSVSNSMLSNNAFGVFNGNGGGLPTTRLYNSTITFNTTAGLQINGGSVISSGNNIIQGNAGNEAPSSNAGTQ